MLLALVPMRAAEAWLNGKLRDCDLLGVVAQPGEDVCLWVATIRGRAEFRAAWRAAQRHGLGILFRGAHPSTERAGNYRADHWQGNRFFASAAVVCKPRSAVRPFKARDTF